MRGLNVGLTGSLLFAWGIAVGAQPVYTYVELDHESIGVDVEDGSGHHLESLGLGGSWQMVNHLALVGEGRRIKEEGGAYKAFSSFRAGAATFWSVFGIAEFNAMANYDFTTQDFGGELGFRARPVSMLELHAELDVEGFPRRKNYRTASGSLEFGLSIHVTKALAVGFDHTRTILGDDIGQINRLFLRYEFGQIDLQ